MVSRYTYALSFQAFSIPSFRCHHKFSNVCCFPQTLQFCPESKAEVFYTKVPNYSLQKVQKFSHPCGFRFEISYSKGNLWKLDFRKKSLLELTLSVRSHYFFRSVDKLMRYLGKRVRNSIVVKILLFSLKRVPDKLR